MYKLPQNWRITGQLLVLVEVGPKHLRLSIKGAIVVSTTYEVTVHNSAFPNG